MGPVQPLYTLGDAMVSLVISTMGAMYTFKNVSRV
jgi:hypothetical protein